MDSRLSKNHSIRTFISLPLSASARASLGSLQTAFSEVAPIIRRTHPDLLHITVVFLGDVPSHRIDDVIAAGRREANRARPLDLSLSDLGAFPNQSAPRILWAGLRRDAGLARLEEIQSGLAATLRGEGFELEDRPFRPHITLARARPTANRSDLQRLGRCLVEVRERTRPDDQIHVSGLDVMRSDLSPSGPAYTLLAVAPFPRISAPHAESGGEPDAVG
ncbi:MAG: RNA 2',3'-cyclic phosphodiesterase [Chloroflexota bacterium]